MILFAQITGAVRRRPMLAVLPVALLVVLVMLGVRVADMGRDNSGLCPKIAPVVAVTYAREPIRYDDSFDGKTLYSFSRDRSFQAITMLSPSRGWYPGFFLGKKDVPLNVVMRTYPAQGEGAYGRVCIDYAEVTIHVVQKSVGFVAREAAPEGACYAWHKAMSFLLDEASIKPIMHFTETMRGALTAHVMEAPPRGPYTKARAAKVGQKMANDLRLFVKPYEEVMTESLYGAWDSVTLPMLYGACDEGGRNPVRGKKKVLRD